MLAARDQENLVHGYQQAAVSKPLNQGIKGAPPKTPGNKYPKTPLKMPLHDENAPAGFRDVKSMLGTRGKGLENLNTGGKLGTNFDKDAFITPLGPRNRAPLGMKTTNAKTKVFQTPAASMSDNRNLEKTQAKHSNSRRPRPKVPHAETVKVDVLGDEICSLNERDVEYCPPKPQDLPYESEDFPDGCLNYDMLRGPNRTRGWQSYYYDPVDQNGVSWKEKQFDEAIAKALKETNEKIRKAVEEAEWTVGDVPETFVNQPKNKGDAENAWTNGKTKKSSNLSSRGPATVTSRNAAAALSVIPKAPLGASKSIKSVSKPTTSFLARKKLAIPTPINISEMRHTAAAVASRSTIGYTKGRSTSNVLNVRFGGFPRSTSNLSTGSDITITPSRFAQKQTSEDSSDEWKRLKFLGVFDTDDDNLEPGLRSMLPDCLRKGDDYQEEFVLTLNSV